MTIRAILLGLLGATFVCAFAYFSDQVMKQTYFVGNNMPISVFGGLILFLIVVNPLLFRLMRRWAFSGGELAVIVVLTLAACVVPGSGLMRYLPGLLVMPHHYNRVESSWQSQGVLDMTPDAMLTDVTAQNHSHVVGGFIRGGADVPWSAWQGTLTFWLPLILVFWVGLIGLSVLVHRQWSDHEHLPYPIAAFANALLPDQDKPNGAVFRNRLFWFALLFVFTIHMTNYASTVWPDQIPQINLSWNLQAIFAKFPTLSQGLPGGSALYRIKIYFSVVAIAYFLATDVSLSLGLGPYIYAIIAGMFLTYGIHLSDGTFIGPQIRSGQVFGSFLGMFLAIVLMGRHYYLHVLRRAVGIKSSQTIDPASVWGARTFGAAMFVFNVLLITFGVDWRLAIIFSTLLVIMFLVMSRIHAETGLFMIQPYWFPTAIMAAVLGYVALEPRTLLVLMMLSMMFTIDPREALMPFIVNGLKIVDLRQVSTGRTGLWCGVALALGLAVAVPAALMLVYHHGYNKGDNWANNSVIHMPYEETVRVNHKLSGQDNIELANATVGWSRLTDIKPQWPVLSGIGAGLVLVLAFTAGRLRFAHWPLHPVMFTTWFSYPNAVFASGFLIGWLVKLMVTRLGGAAAYQRFKPLMIGLIAGDMLGGLGPMCIGYVSYLITNEPPTKFLVLPG